MKGSKMRTTNVIKYLLLLWILSVVVRLPQLNRPLAKHHEYNTAVVLMNIETWRAVGGAHHFHYIPVLNYPAEGDRLPARSAEANFDENGNALYFSFGAGWYLFPYLFYQIFQWPAIPLYLQLLNLLLHGLSAGLWWRWLSAPARNQLFSTSGKLISVAALLFLPGMLWYNGNGYVNTSLSIPLLIGWLLSVDAWKKKAQFSTYGYFCVMSMLCVYTDWFIVFLCVAFAGMEMSKQRKDWRKAFATAFYWMTPVGIGIGIILLQYASYVGWKDTWLVMSNRFTERSVLDGATGSRRNWVDLLSHYLSLYLPIVVFLGYASLVPLKNTFRKDPFLVAYGCALLLYHVTFFEWSAVHEFAMLADVLWLVYIVGKGTPESNPVRVAAIAGLFFIACITQFYWINRPGEKSRNGLPYRQYEVFGTALKSVPKTATLFMDPFWTAELQYHAGRTILKVPDEATARQRMVDWKIQEAYWIEHKDYQVLSIHRIQPIGPNQPSHSIGSY